MNTTKLHILLTYVDDIVKATNCASKDDWVKKMLFKHFLLKETAGLTLVNESADFLGRILTRASTWEIWISMADEYLDELFKHFGVADDKKLFLIPVLLKSSNRGGDQTLDTTRHKLYRRFVGKFNVVSSNST